MSRPPAPCPPSARPRIEGLVVAALAVVLACVYALQPARGREVHDNVTRFYKPLPHEGISLNAANTIQHLESGEFTNWTYMTAREALVRWHLKANAPEAFDSLMARWQTGLWDCPPTEEWTRTLEEFDRQWIDRRMKAGKPVWLTPQNMSQSDVSIAIWPESAVQTADKWEFTLNDDAPETVQLILNSKGLPTERLGSRIVLTFAPGTLDLDAAPPRTYWATQQLPISGLRVKTGIVKIDETSGVQNVAFDFSNEPGWLGPNAQLKRLAIHLTPAERRIDLRTITGEDSFELE